MTSRRDKVFATSWGLAEATVFFIVPDVLLSWYALSGLKRGLLACLYALAGALAGGLLVWYWGQIDPNGANAFFVSLPGINEALVSAVNEQVTELGFTALMVGPLSGTPYKLYAAAAPGHGQALLMFLLVSIPARLVRFVIVTVVIGFVGQQLRRKFTLRQVKIVHLSCWLVFYLWYFYMMAAS